MNAPVHSFAIPSVSRRAAALAVGLLLLLALGPAGCSTTHGDVTNERLKDWLSTLDNGGRDMSFRQHEAMAYAALEAGDAREALRHADKGLELQPGDAAALVLRARALHRLERQREALDALATVLRADPANPAANLEAGRICFAARLLPEAEQRLRAVLESSRASGGGEAFQAHMLLGAVAEQRGDAEAAVRSYESALALRPGSHEALNNLGVARMTLGRYDEAAQDFSAAIRSGGAQERSCNNLGLAMARMGRTDEALQAFKCAGSDARAHNNLGYVLLVQGDYQGAVHHLERAVELSPVFYPQAGENLKRARLAAGGVMGIAPAPARQIAPAVPAVPLRPASFTVQPQAVPAAPAQPEQARPVRRTAAPVERTISEEPEARLAPGPDDAVAELASGGPATDEVAAQVGRAGGEVRLSAVRPASAPAASFAATPAPAAVVPAAGASAAPGGWGLLISSWKVEEQAQAHLRKLAERGVEARLVQADLGEKGVWMRVVWGDFSSASEALAARSVSPGNLDLSRSCPVRTVSTVPAPVLAGAAI